MNLHRSLTLLLVASLLLFETRLSLAAVPPSADWIEVQRYTGGMPEGPFHSVYLIPNGTIISNFAKASASPIAILQSLELGAPVPPGRSWQVIHRWEKNPLSGEGDVQFESTYAIPMGNTVHLVRASNLAGFELEKLPNSPITLR